MSSVYLQTLLSGLSVGAIYGLIALSFNITFTTTKTLNFAQGDLVAAGAFIGVSALVLLAGGSTIHQLPRAAASATFYSVAAIAAGLAVGVVGVLVFLAAVRPFAGKPGLSWVMSTLGFGIILQSAGLLTWGAEPVSVPSPMGDQVLRVFGAGIRPQEILVLGVALAIMLSTDVFMRKSRIGKAMRAVAHNPQTASLMGINTQAIMIGSFAISGVLAGIAGVLIAPITSASLFLGLSVALKGFSGAILGGLTSARGCILGGFLLGILESAVAMWQAQWREVVVFLIIILVLALRPTGLFGRATVDKV